MIDLRLWDCLEVMKDIPDKSVDMILCDLPLPWFSLSILIMIISYLIYSLIQSIIVLCIKKI